MKFQARQIQTHIADDGDYVSLVDFALRYAPLLHKTFRPKRIWSEKEIERTPRKSDVTRFNYGATESGITIVHKVVYESEENYSEDEVIATCYGFPQNVFLQLRTHRHCSDPRLVEIRVSGPEETANLIFERFDAYFAQEHCQDRSDVSWALETAERATWIHAWRVVESSSIKALEREPANDRALMYIGIARAAQGFEPEGESHLLASLTLNPKNPDAYHNLGLLVLRQGRCLLASDCFEYGLALEPSNHAMLFHYGQSLERLGKFEEALTAYEQVVSSAADVQEKSGFGEMDFVIEARKAIEGVRKSIDAGNEGKGVGNS